MAKPKYILYAPSKRYAASTGKQVTAISVYDDADLARRMKQAHKLGVTATFQRLK